jgi:hypothetical protein
MKNEVCQRFLRRCCPHGSRCMRIHPRRNPLLPDVQVLTNTMPDQQCRQGNQVKEGHNVAGPLLQTSPRIEDLLTTQDSPKPVVKLPSKDQNRACLESSLSQVCLDFHPIYSVQMIHRSALENLVSFLRRRGAAR